MTKFEFTLLGALLLAAPAPRVLALELSAEDTEDAVEVGDMLLEPGQAVLADGPQAHGKGVNGQMSLIRPLTAPWPEGRLPVVFEDGIDDGRKARFFSACREWQARAGVRCVDRADEEVYVHVVEGAGCYSHVGYGRRVLGFGEARERTLSLGEGCWSQTVIVHELGHAFGLMHEQMRMDRDRYVTILWENIEQENRNQYYWTPGYTSGSEYDFDSIMHYWNGAFAKEPGLPTFEAKPGYEEALERVGTGSVPSELDARAVWRLSGQPEIVELEPVEKAPKVATLKGSKSGNGGRRSR